MITVEHIRFARVNQLAKLLEVPLPHASAILSGRGISERVLSRGTSKGIPVEVLINGIALKRQDLIDSRKFQSELEAELEAL